MALPVTVASGGRSSSAELSKAVRERSGMQDPVRQEVIALAHSVVVKIGTNVLTSAEWTARS